MSGDWSLLRRLLVERHWQRYSTFRVRFEEAAARLARETGQPRLARLTVSPRQFDRWVYGEIVSLPRDDACQVLEDLLGRPVHELFATTATPTKSRETPGPLVAAPETATDGVEDLVLAAAEESREHADRLAVAGVDALAVDRLRDQVIALAGEFAVQAPAAVVPRARHLRRLACELLDRTPRPAQARELYLVAGAACGLLASASFDLGHRDAAAAHADAVWTYGGLIGHTGVQAWARGMQALLANWSGRPRQAQQLVSDGLRLAPGGGARVRLHGIEARAWSHLGDRGRTDAAVSAGLSALGDQGEDELHEQIGGEFGFGPARHAWCVSSAYVQLGDGPAAAHHAMRAIALYQQLPPADRTPKAAAAAAADLAAAHLLQAELDGAEDVLRGVLTLPTQHRVESVRLRLTKVATLLRTPKLRGAPAARTLLEGIDAFAAPAALLPRVAGLPSGPLPG